VGFDLAIVSGLLGSLILATGLMQQAPVVLRLKLRRIGVLFLLATVGFVVYGVLFSMIEYSIAQWVVAFGMTGGAICFAMGVLLLVLTVPRLWSMRED